jgi:hypothetical protein
MSALTKFNCIKVSAVAVFLLIFQAVVAQYHFSESCVWLKDNAVDPGGRIVMMICKDGKIVYSHSENNLIPGRK